VAVFLGQTVSKYENFDDATLETGMVEVDTQSVLTINNPTNPIVGAASLTVNCTSKTEPAYVYDTISADHFTFLLRFRACVGVPEWSGGPSIVHGDNPGIASVFIIRDERSAGTNARQLACDYFVSPVPVTEGAVYSIFCDLTRNGAFAYKIYNAANEIIAEGTSAFTLPDVRVTQLQLGDASSGTARPVTVQLDDYVIDTDTAAEILPYEAAPTTFSVLYHANGATGGYAPSDRTEYAPGDPATVLGNTDRLTRALYRFTGWNTAANGTGTHCAPADIITMGSANVTLYAEWAAYVPSGQQIGHANHDPSGYSNAQILAAAALDVYLEHASVGAYIVGGIGALRSSVPRLTTEGITWSDTSDPTWFAAHNGLGDNNRGNPGAATKISGFTSRMASIASAVDVAFYKFCYIDYPADGAALFDSYNAAIIALESAYPDIVIPRCTMPLESTGADVQRQRFNDLLREYCVANNRWLYDIADIESHNDAGVAQLDAGGMELLTAAYTDDGGHPNSGGSQKLALGYWSLVAAIAADVPAVYTVIFDDDGGSYVAPQEVESGGLVVEPTNLTKTHYTFDRWYSNWQRTVPWNFSSDTITEDRTLYANYLIDSFVVAFNSLGGSSVESITANYSSTIAAPVAPTRTNYIFGGWYREEACVTAWVFDSDPVEGSLMLYAKWTQLTNRVTFDSQGGSAAPYEDIGVGDAIATIPVPARTGFNFQGWFTQPIGAGTRVLATTIPMAAMTVYASWAAAVATVGECYMAADDGAADPVAEGSTKTVEVSFFDEAGTAMVPDTVTWSLYNGPGVLVHAHEDVPATSGATVRIVLSGLDHAVTMAQETRRLVVQATYTSTDGASLPLVGEFQYPVTDVTGI
jgi:uncharacterized repeat protein (TIGR02543 family)